MPWTFFFLRCNHRTVWLSHSCSYKGITCAIANKNKWCRGKFEFQMNNNKSFKYIWNIAWVILIQKTKLLLSEIQISLGILYFIWRFSVLFIISKLYKWNAAAAAKLLQLCPTLCNPIDSSPPGSPIPGILPARTLEWVTISFSNVWKWSRSVVSDPQQPQGLQPSRLLRPWDFPGKSTGVGCHCLLWWNAAVRTILPCFIVMGILQTEFHFLRIKWAANVRFG